MNSDTNYTGRLQRALADKYVIERELGRGWMGIVYLAHEPAFDRHVALKVLLPELATSVRHRALFLREAGIAARRSHPNIVPVHAMDELDEFVYFTMAYVRGVTLTDLIRLEGPLPPEEATRIVREVAGAVHYAHRHGVIHRDLKSDNILIDRENDRPMVADFGIARVLDQYDIVREGYAVGTAPFMSPEQCRNDPVDERSDVYALGVVGYVALTGRLPFRGATPKEIMDKQIEEPPPPLAEPSRVFPGPLPEAIDRCLAKRPQDRFQTAGELVRALAPRVALGKEMGVLLDRLRDAVGYAIGGAIAVFFFFGGPSRGVWFNLAVFTSAIALALGGSLLYVLPKLRHALKARYRREDILDAVRGDVRIRTENIRFQFPKNAGWVERIAWVLGGGGVLSAIGGLGLGALGLVDAEASLASASLGVIAAFVFVPIALVRYAQRADRLGKRLYGFLKGTVGGWLIKVAGLGLPSSEEEGDARPGLDDAMLDAMPTDEVLAQLPPDLRDPVADLLEAMRVVEERRAGVHQWVKTLDSHITALPDAAPPALLEAEDEARDALAVSGAALVGMRAQVLGARNGLATHESITAQITAAHRIAATVDRVLAAREEVEELLNPPKDVLPFRRKGA
jgi:hypothetical protein